MLFGPGTGSQANACVNSIDNIIVYQDGYRRAALHLAEYVCDTGQGQDFLVYPIVFLYRHHIELTLKSIIGVTNVLLDRDLTKKELDTLGSHNLGKLWGLARPLLGPACALGGSPELPPDDMEGIDSYISQLHKHDPDGQRFRYATTKSKDAKARPSRSLSADLKYINIRDFVVALEKLADYLDGLDMWFGDLIAAKFDFKAKYAGGGL